MGLAVSIMRLMIRMHKAEPWHGPVLTLGVQDVPATYDELVKVYRSEKADFVPVPAAERRTSTSDLFKRSGLDNTGYIHPTVFFKTLGVQGYDDVDFSDFEKPTLIHDFNHPIPDAWHGRYGMVVDGGTAEHIFDIRSTLANTVQLLRVGGDVLHISPVCGWINHGFYQYSPCLFYDYYGANGFESLTSYLVQMPRDPKTHQEIIQPYTYTLNTFELDDRNYRTLFVYRARKRTEQALKAPVQGYYQKLLKAG
jgi:hypothetical protein